MLLAKNKGKKESAVNLDILTFVFLTSAMLKTEKQGDA